MIELDQMWFIFQHSLPCLTHTFPIGVAALGFLWYILSSHPNAQKVLNFRCDLIICPILLPSSVFFHDGEQKIVRWCQIRRTWREINHFKATVMHSSHCDHRLVCRGIVLVKQDSLSQFSRPFTKSFYYYFSKSWITYPAWVYLEGNNALSIRKGWI